MPNNINCNHFLTDPVSIVKQKWSEGTKPLVSIFCITYNHQYFISEAIEGFLAQKTTFPVEILIYDDASNDGTAEIVRDYEKRIPELILPLYQNENQFSQGINPFSKFLVSHARGNYIAVCEGDDYWIDPLKLQKQVDIFNNHPDTIICGARAKIWSEGKKEFTNVSPAQDKDIACMTPKQFFYGGNWVKNCTRMTPKELMLSVPLNYFRDYRLVHYLLAKNPNGTFRCLDEVVAVYREHAGGIFSGADPVDLLVYNFESKVLLAGLFSDDRMYSMKERAADTAWHLLQTKTLVIRKRAFYAWQYIFLLYGDLSLPGIKRMILRSFDLVALHLTEYPKIKQFFKPLALFVRRKFLND